MTTSHSKSDQNLLFGILALHTSWQTAISTRWSTSLSLHTS